MAMDMVEVPGAARGFERREVAGAGLGRETYATFLLIAIAGFIIAGYLGLALFFIGAVR
jgi:hypothetical protein